jgi:uncharacterized protein (TIGR00255 family)
VQAVYGRMISMIRSMTGFGRGEAQLQLIKISTEVKSLNHRYLDTSIKMPKILNYLEEKVRQKIKDSVKRGRVEVFIGFEKIGDTDIRVSADLALAKQYIDAFQELSDKLSITNDMTVSALVKFPDVIIVDKKESDEDEIWSCLSDSLNTALYKLVAMREHEGDLLREDFNKRLEIVTSMIVQIEDKSPQILEGYRQKLLDRMKEILEDVQSLDESRLLMEAAIYADKSNVTEEIVRFHSHIRQFRAILDEDDSVGRKLDFLIQEMNREVNTIGSKANDLFVTNIVISLKSELEKLREQIQNIE